MIQRIQTIWLILAALCAFLSFKLAFYTGTMLINGVQSFAKIDATTSIPLIAGTAAVGVLAIIAIFLYKTRKMQLRLCVVGLLIEAVVIFLYYTEIKKLTAGTGTYALTALLQACIVLFFFLAAKGINNDDKIIKESNRLR
ncbi:MAG: DUF4293 family protein [Chitinophagaceae bacterium]|nr:MAG: DUF4293 family protein [Chitinophagaceae bacterium]